jgi:tRNA-splicing ligase RtcB
MAHVVYNADSRAEPDLVEEAPGAYKDIREVLDAQRELVQPLRRLTPLAVVKG